MHIKVNGQARELPGDMAPLRAVLEWLGVDPEQTGIAVALNEAVAPRSQWGTTMVQGGDVLEIITARQGG